MEKALGKMEAETRNACHVLSMDGNAWLSCLTLL